MGASGVRSRRAQHVNQTVVGMMESCFLGEKVDAIERDLTLPNQTLFGHVPRHLLTCKLHSRIERRAKPLALIVVGEAIEQVIAELLQILPRDRRGVDRVLPSVR